MEKPKLATRHSSTSSQRRPTPLRHPTPDLQTLQGAYIKNITNLERSAEEMSASGSDLGEEIRRLSRQNSVRSASSGNAVRPSVLERMGSSRSVRSNSYGVPSAARWGGYSPNGFVASPVGSTSGSWSHASLSRVQSGSGSRSRLAHVTEPVFEGKPLDSPLRASFSVHSDDQEAQPVEQPREVSQSSFAQRYDEIAGQIESSLEHVPPSPTQDAYHQQALHNLATGAKGLDLERRRSNDTYREAQLAFKDFDGVHFSPDTDEFVEIDAAGQEVRRVSARTSSGNISQAAVSMLRTAHDRPIPQAAPPPEDDMVFYPAPVPRMLNLPKRLSQLPAANVQAKRRSQVLSGIPPEARAGAPWLKEETLSEGGGVTTRQRSSGSGSSGPIPRGGFLNERMSGIHNLPDQLRANMFFEHQPVQHDVEIKSESAVATLDGILAASATAPVHAFTDHPYAGDVRRSVYGPDRTARRSTATLASIQPPEQKKVKKRRSSSIGGLLKRALSSDEVTTTLQKRNSRASMLTDFNEGGNKLKKRQSQLSLGTQLDKEAEPEERPTSQGRDLQRQSGLIAAAQNADDDRRVSRAPTVMSSGYKLDDADVPTEGEAVADSDSEGDVDGDALFVQPSTLLAELQVRKAQLKSRNKTAATAFPNGMHSTLLQLDAVEEINKRKRQHQRIALAWEDPHQRALETGEEDGDEDVPLGMLFAGGRGGRMGNVVGGDVGGGGGRALGLMEKRELEDSEPLSRRMRRLRGRSPERGKVGLGVSEPREQLVMSGGIGGGEVGAGAGEEEKEEEEEETLGQRLQKLKMKNELDGAISDVAGDAKDGSRPASGLLDEVMSQFGGLDVPKDSETAAGAQSAGASPQIPQEEEEETLGQRRARLQREREAAGGAQPASSIATALRPSTSLANLLASNPVGQRSASKAHEPAQGSLLHANAQVQAQQREHLQSTNANSSFHGLDRPLVDSKQRDATRVNEGGLLAQEKHLGRPNAGGFAAGRFNNGTGGIEASTPQGNVVPPMVGTGMANGYFPAPATPAMAGYGGFFPQQQQSVYQPQYPQAQAMMSAYPPQMNPLAYENAGAYGYPYAYGGNSYMPQTLGGGTYASFAQSQGMGMLGEEGMTGAQRSAIDRWRLGVQGQ